MNTITENDIAQIKHQIVKKLTEHLDGSGVGNLAKQIISLR